MEEKYCKDCDSKKPVDQFYTGTNKGKPCLSTYCKPCTRIRQKAYGERTYTKEERSEKHRQWRAKNPEAMKRHRLKKIADSYGIDLEDVKRVSERTACDICGSDYRLSVDHCHTTLKVRGLLCGKCNSALGFFKDDIEIMRKAIEYVQNEGLLDR